jgi:hypothetical protein
MIGFLITLLVVILVVGLIFWGLMLLGVPQPWLNFIRVVVGLIVLIWALYRLLPLTGVPLR